MNALRALTGASTDALRDYLRRIGPFETLTAQEEVDVARRIDTGALAAGMLGPFETAGTADEADLVDVARDGRSAYEEFMRANLKLVVTVAKHYTGHGLSMLDLIQNGNVGLDRAVRRFDPERGFKFSTYAVWWIRQSIWQSLATEARVIRIPVHTMERINSLRRVRADLVAELGGDVTDADVADEAGLPVGDVRWLMSADREPLSLDSAPGRADADGDPGVWSIPDDRPTPDSVVEDRLMRQAVRTHVEALADRDRRLIRMRFGLSGHEPMTLSEIGDALGVSKQRVRQLEKRALERLRCAELRSFL